LGGSEESREKQAVTPGPVQRRYDPRYEIISDQEGQESLKRPPSYEIIKTLTPTALVVAGFLSHSHVILFSLAGLSVVGVFYDQIRHAIIAVKDKSHNKHVAKRNLRQLRNFSEELGPFLDVQMNRSDTFQGIANEITRKYPQIQYRSPIPPVELLYQQWHFLNIRIQRDHFTPEQFHGAARELWNVLSGFSLYCVYRSYEAFAQHSSTIDAQCKSQFNSFQQNWTTFGNGWMKFTKQVNKDLRGFEPLPNHITLPLPLV
jgi:hypothetical protein